MNGPFKEAPETASRARETRTVVGPDGAPEPFTWVVQYQDGSVAAEIDPGDGPDRSFVADVNVRPIASLWLLPQRAELASHGLRVPPGCVPWFARRRQYEGVVGLSGSEHLTSSLTGIGWRDAAGTGPTLFFLADGSSLAGIDDGSLTIPGAWRTSGEATNS